MIRTSRRADHQLDILLQHYTRIGRPEAARNLLRAVDEAAEKIEQNPKAGMVAPRSYPHLARAKRAWIKVGRYWLNYTLTEPPVIVAIFHDTADIPRRGP